MIRQENEHNNYKKIRIPWKYGKKNTIHITDALMFIMKIFLNTHNTNSITKTYVPLQQK